MFQHGTFYLLFVGIFASGWRTHAINPAITYRYSADPSAHVWPGSSRIWVYTSVDPDDDTGHETMVDWSVYSSADLVEWTDHGIVLSLKDIKGARLKAWAPDAVYRNGKYYLVYCVEDERQIFRAGLAESDKPEGPFKDIGFIVGVEWGQDPALFIDDDDQAYLYWGLAGHILVTKLHDNLTMAIPGTEKKLQAPGQQNLPGAYEGPWMHKRRGLYYLSYPAVNFSDFNAGEWMEYSTATSPMGPFTPHGVIMERTGCWTNHGSIVEYKGQWYFFYHTHELSGSSRRRNVAIEYLHYRNDGTIKPIQPTREGVEVPTLQQRL